MHGNIWPMYSLRQPNDRSNTKDDGISNLSYNDTDSEINNRNVSSGMSSYTDASNPEVCTVTIAFTMA